jgi:glycosyltransferase involved in cell wall biosynthesis
MHVSVIIPTYNSAALVVEAIESVLAQTLPPHQIIVVDDGSTDDTYERARAYSGLIEYITQPNSRVAAARNTGLGRATGDLVAFLDADDVWHPRKLERQVALLRENPSLGLLATQLTPWPGTPFTDECVGHGATMPVPLAELLVFNSLATSSIVVRRAVLRQAGQFDAELFGPEDYDLWLRCAQHAPVAVLEEPLTGYRDTAGSVGKQAPTMRQGLLRIHDKLDRDRVWPNRWIRRKCRAHLDYSTGYMFFAGGSPELATPLLMQSLCRYPLPMSHREVRSPGGRLRLLLRSLAATGTIWLRGAFSSAPSSARASCR